MSNLVSLTPQFSSTKSGEGREGKGREGEGGVRVVVEATEIICPTFVAVRYINYRTVS